MANPTFEQLIIAGMLDAAAERKMSQFKVTVTPEQTKRETFVRIIIVPESMDLEWPQGMPDGKKPNERI